MNHRISIARGLVDVHTHAIAPELPDLGPGRWPAVRRLAADRAEITLGGQPYREIDDRCWSAARRLRDMDAEGVAVQFVSPIPATLCHGEDADGAAELARAQNEFLAGLAADAPGRIVALGAVPLQDPRRAVAELVRCVEVLRFPGVEIGTRVGELELSDPVLDPFFDAAADLGAFVLVHPVDDTIDPRSRARGLGFGLGMPTETAIAAAGLITGRERRAGARICLAHAGGCLPGILPRLDRGEVLAGRAGRPGHRPPSERARELWCDSLAYDADSLLLATRRFGAEHVLLGTDYPFAAREAPAGAVLDHLDPADRPDLSSAIGRTNALNLIAEHNERGGRPWARSSVSC